MKAELDGSSAQGTLTTDCVIAFGIPTTKDDFESSIKDPNRDYGKRYLAGWDQYERMFGSELARLIPFYQQLGVKVVSQLKSSGVSALFQNSRAITLFTHWTASGIELCDGIIGLTEFVDFIPTDFRGILDLCVCHPDDLVNILLRERPLCTIKYLSNKKTSPMFWLQFYSALYKILAMQRGRTYSDELAELILGLRHVG